MSFETYAENKSILINRYIESSLQKYRKLVSQRFLPLVDAMEYSLQGGGKRLRPLLVCAAADYLGLKTESVLPAACAMEYIHTYSLIHDDLPALDNDATRRGKPSSHIKYGEAVALLAGDALLTEAFTQLSYLKSHGFNAEQVLQTVELLTQHSGVRGLVGGQLLDVMADIDNYSLPEVEFIHIHKTGALILCATLLPTKLVAPNEKKFQHLKRYGEAVGLAFQISDDLLDSESVVRYSRGPRSKPKPSYTKVMGPSEVKEKLNRLIETAIQNISAEGSSSEPLVWIADFIRRRKH